MAGGRIAVTCYFGTLREQTGRRITMGLFGPPDVEKMKAKGDVKGLIKALGY
jgi:hypothetical protein